MPPQKRSASPAKGSASNGAIYAKILADIEKNSVPKPGARPPTDKGTTAEGHILADNATKANVISLPGGLQYRVIKNGKQKDAPSPKIDSQCDVHYRGVLIDGTEFDTSKKPSNKGKPATFAPNKVIQGWTIALQLMGEGDKWQLYVPSELAYGDAGRGKFIGPGDVLIFEMELLKVHGSSKPKPVRPIQELSAAIAAPSAPSQAEGAVAVDVSDQRPPSAKRPKPSAAPLASVAPLATLPASTIEPAMKVTMTEQADSNPMTVDASEENASPNTLPANPAEKVKEEVKPAAPAEVDVEALTNRAFDEGVDTTLEAMAAMLNKLEVPTLQQALSDLGLPTSGRKEQLTERLTAAIQDCA